MLEVGTGFCFIFVANLGVLNGNVPNHEYKESKDVFGGFEVLDFGACCRRGC